MRITRGLLGVGIAAPFIFFGTLIVCGWLTPGYSHVSQYGSELGAAGSPTAGLFKAGVLWTAFATIAAALGLYRAADRLGSGRLWSILAGVALGLFGVGLVFGALFPMPDPRHGGFGLGMAVHGAPLFLALALRREHRLRNLNLFLVLTTAVMVTFFAIMMGVGELVTRANVGVYQRLYSLTVFGWIAVAGVALRRTLSSR